MSDVIKMAVEELHKMFTFLNKHLFGNALPEPVITIQTNGRRKNVMAWCITEKVWRDKEQKEKKYEVNVCPEYLNYPILETADSIAHEMVHLYNKINNVNDISRNGSYHNKKFKAMAESIGLTVERSNKVGWGLTKPGPQFIELIKELQINESAFYMARNTRLSGSEEEGEESGEGEKKPVTNRKYVCPCGTIVRATKKVKVICGECKQPFTCVNVDEEEEQGQDQEEQSN